MGGILQTDLMPYSHHVLATYPLILVVVFDHMRLPGNGFGTRKGTVVLLLEIPTSLAEASLGLVYLFRLSPCLLRLFPRRFFVGWCLGRAMPVPPKTKPE